MMTTNTILDEAENRLANAAAQVPQLEMNGLRVSKLEIIEGMRDQIGRENYEQAQDELPKLVAFIDSAVRPWQGRVETMVAQATTPLPKHTQDILLTIKSLCDTPKTIQLALDCWSQLAPPVFAGNSRRVDTEEIRKIVAGNRQCLRNWDGVKGTLESLMGQVDRYIKDAEWPGGA